ncbi:hypothetical protein IB232_20245 [Pseudomonas sp. PDM15]|uniref:hypothetical protein n=1 Tax=Pseudomonas sp. PDM15 TaxID=2769303 RepID=UPI0017804899|nr:hypothetical protein [Pseudomonas sp. PDM15]MBD9427674.1 hypothetical protein [Pseudomonas sp. PDM15]
MRVDDEGVYIRPRHKERSSSEWLGITTLAIVLGTFITDGTPVLAANAWMNYQLEQLPREFQRGRAENERSAELRQQAFENQQLEKRLQSHECRFWQEEYSNNPTEKAKCGRHKAELKCKLLN